MSTTSESRWIEQTSDDLKATGHRRFVKKLSFMERGVGRSVRVETVVEAEKSAPPEDTFADDFYDWLEMMPGDD